MTTLTLTEAEAQLIEAQRAKERAEKEARDAREAAEQAKRQAEHDAWIVKRDAAIDALLAVDTDGVLKVDRTGGPARVTFPINGRDEQIEIIQHTTGSGRWRAPQPTGEVRYSVRTGGYNDWKLKTVKNPTTMMRNVSEWIEATEAKARREDSRKATKEKMIEILSNLYEGREVEYKNKDHYNGVWFDRWAISTDAGEVQFKAGVDDEGNIFPKVYTVNIIDEVLKADTAAAVLS